MVMEGGQSSRMQVMQSLSDFTEGNPKPGNRKPDRETRNWNPETRDRNSESGIRNPESTNQRKQVLQIEIRTTVIPSECYHYENANKVRLSRL